MERSLAKVLEVLESRCAGGGGDVYVKEEGASQENSDFMVSSHPFCTQVCI